MGELTWMSATELAGLIRARRVSAREVVTAHLERIATHNPALNAVVTLDAEGALARADAADTALARGDVWGPLHGVPLTAKDAFNTAGLRTTCGYPPLAGNIPTTDATVVARLRAAGAIILGKTNVPQLLDDVQTDNPIFGRTNNPWDLARTPGGSSGGSAAAVAAGLAPADIGSDYGGSIRIPAHYCGIYGLRPTEHRISMAGHLPPLDSQPRGIRHITTPGPLARSVADLDLLLRVLAGPDAREWEVPPVALEPLPALSAGELRIAWSADLGALPVGVDTRAALERLGTDLERAGCRVEQRASIGDGIDLDDVRATLATISAAEWGASGWGDLDPRDAGEPPTMGEYTAALTRRDALITAFQRNFGEIDALICPVAPGPAFPHCPQGTPIDLDGVLIPYRTATSGFTVPLSLFGCPIVTLPIGCARNGLPIGVQLVGPRWGEARLLAVAALLDQVAGGYRHPPGYASCR